MPITRFQTVGNLSKPGQFDKTDRAILQSEKAVEKIHRQFGKTGIDFNFYLFHKVPMALRGMREGEEIELALLEDQPEEYYGISKENAEQIINESSDSITIIYRGNSGAEKYMFTGWTMAHRIGHAIRRVSSWRTFETYIFDLIFNQILRSVFKFQTKSSRLNFPIPQENAISKKVMSAMGTMKSARESNLRTPYEFLYELFAQYLITGKVKLNPIPKQLLSHYTWGTAHHYTAQDMEALEFFNSLLPQKENDIEMLLDDVLGEAIGSVFVI